MHTLTTLTLVAAAVISLQAQNAPVASTLQELEKRTGVYKGDLEVMENKRVIRALVSFNKSSYFIDQGRPRGISYEALTEFERFLNHKLHPNDRTGKDKINVVLIPTSHEKLQSDLLNGHGDIAAIGIAITDERKKIADFIPVASDRQDVVVAGVAAPSLSGLDDLAGKEVYLFKEGVSWTDLAARSTKLATSGKSPIQLKPADANIDWEDLVEMANAGMVQYAVVPLHIARLWKSVFPELKIYDSFPVTEKLEVGWAVRKDSPKLRALLEEFAKTHRVGTAFGNTLVARYLKNPQFVKNNRSPESVKRFNEMAAMFQKYARRYQFPWLMIAAEAYQESGLDQSVKSHVGAVGVMQVMPATAAASPVKVADIHKLENNIHAGVRLLKYLRDDYFKNDPMDPINKSLMTVAAYNAGPARIKQCRQMAAEMGLNPNLWFKNVEYAVAKRVGAETVNYVSNIYKYYLGYKLQTERDEARAAAKSGVSK